MSSQVGLRMQYLQEWKGYYRVRVPVRSDLRPLLPAPYTDKSELLKGLGIPVGVPAPASTDRITARLAGQRQSRSTPTSP